MNVKQLTNITVDFVLAGKVRTVTYEADADGAGGSMSISDIGPLEAWDFLAMLDNLGRPTQIRFDYPAAAAVADSFKKPDESAEQSRQRKGRTAKPVTEPATERGAKLIDVLAGPAAEPLSPEDAELAKHFHSEAAIAPSVHLGHAVPEPAPEPEPELTEDEETPWQHHSSTQSAAPAVSLAPQSTPPVKLSIVPPPAPPAKVEPAKVEPAADSDLEEIDVPDALLQPGARLKQVAEWLYSRGIVDADAAFAEAERLKANIPLLARAADLKDRLGRLMDSVAAQAGQND